MLQHRVIGEADLAGDLDALHLGLHALELDAVVELVELDAVEHAEEIEMPPGAAEFAVGGELEADLLLLLDDLLDLAVLDLFELGRGDRALLALRARLLDRRGAQQAADHGRRGMAAWFVASLMSSDSACQPYRPQVFFICADLTENRLFRDHALFG